MCAGPEEMSINQEIDIKYPGCRLSLTCRWSDGWESVREKTTRVTVSPWIAGLAVNPVLGWGACPAPGGVSRKGRGGSCGQTLNQTYLGLELFLKVWYSISFLSMISLRFKTVNFRWLGKAPGLITTFWILKISHSSSCRSENAKTVIKSFQHFFLLCFAGLRFRCFLFFFKSLMTKEHLETFN